jgi:hypothetical protein
MNAELLLMFTLNCDRAYPYAHPERELTDDEQTGYDQALAERARGLPTPGIRNSGAWTSSSRRLC